MGLSGRRRARKPATAAAPVATATADARGDRQRTGNTLRRLDAEKRRQLMHAGLLTVKDRRRHGQSQLQPEMPPEYHEFHAGPAAPNRNHWHRDMVQLHGETLDTRVSHSLKKLGRWSAAARLQEDYDNEEEELQSVNLFILEAEALARGGRTRRLTANCGHVTLAADELRSHKRSLRSQKRPKTSRKGNCGSSELSDNFDFSDEVRRQQEERPLRPVGGKSSGAFVNETSVVRSFNLWSHLYNVSPQAEAQRMQLQREYEQRPEVIVQLVQPASAGQRRTGWDEPREKEFLRRTERPERVRRDRLRDSLHLQLHCDQAADCCEELLEQQIFEEQTPRIDTEEEAGVERPAAPTLFDFFVAQPMARQQKKKAAKAKKVAKVAKARNDSGRSDTSGYSSGRSEAEEQEEQEEEEASAKTATPATSARAEAWVQESLTAPRPTVSLPRDLASPARLSELFASADGACILGASWPLKVAVALRPELTEFAVFEELGCSAGRRSFTLRHSVAEGVEAATSLEELAAHADPFARLKELLDERRSRDSATSATDSAAMAALAAGCLSGWRRGRVLHQAAAEVAALRELPMFQAAPAGAEDPEIVAAECEICCRQLAAGQEFADAWTALAGCGHAFCNGCWARHLVLGAAAGRTRLACPAFGCRCHVDAATALWFCPAAVLPALTQAAFRRWLRADSDARRLRGFCRNDRCCRLLQADANCNVVCGACSSAVCLRCRGEPHWPADCSAARMYQQQMLQLGHTTLSLVDLTSEASVQAKNCPRCQLIIEKGVGCNHMSCPCGEHFCWWCGRPLAEHSNGGVCYRQGQGRSSFSVEKVFRAEDSVLVPNSRQSRLYCSAVRQRLQHGSRQSLATRRRGLVDLFFDFALRVEGSSVKEAARVAETRADQLLVGVQQAAQLLEFSLVSLDRRRPAKRQRLLCLALGDHVRDLVAMATDAVRELPLASRRHQRLSKQQQHRQQQHQLQLQRRGEQARMLLHVAQQLRAKCRALNCVARDARHRCA